MPIERAKKTNVIILSKEPVSITSVTGKRSDQTFFTNIQNYTLSGNTIRLRKAFDEIKVDYVDDQPADFDPKVAQAILNGGLGNLLVGNSTNELKGTAFDAQLDRLAVEATKIGEKIGTDLGGFISLAEDAKENLEANDEPIVSIVTEKVDGVTTKKISVKETEIATLTGTTDAGGGLLNIAITTGNPKGIEKVLKEVFTAKESQIKQNLKNVSPVENRVEEAVKKDIATEVSNESQKINQKAMRDLGLPFGSNSELGFGNLGSSFGNILGGVLGKIREVGTSSKIGEVVGGFPESVQIPSGTTVDNIIEANGNTNVSKIVSKNRNLNKNVKTSAPTYQVTRNPGTFNGTLTPSTYKFERVDNAEELELELRTSPREITACVVDWSETYTNNNLDANLVHKVQLGRILEKYGSQFAIQLGIEGGIQFHYVIMRDGTIERGRPLSVEAGGFNPWAKRSVYVGFVAGYNAPEGTPNPNLYRSSESITPEQWKSFDIFLDQFYKAVPAGEVVGKTDLLDVGVNDAPGFDVRSYLKTKYKKTSIYPDAVLRTTTQPKTKTESVNSLPNETAKSSLPPIAQLPKVKDALKNKDKVFDVTTGKIKLPTEEELETAKSDFKTLVSQTGLLSRDQKSFFDNSIESLNLGSLKRAAATLENNELLKGLDLNTDKIDIARNDLLNNGFSFDEILNDRSKK